jgi:C4-type Zn-finger protein
MALLRDLQNPKHTAYRKQITQALILSRLVIKTQSSRIKIPSIALARNVDVIIF